VWAPASSFEQVMFTSAPTQKLVRAAACSWSWVVSYDRLRHVCFLRTQRQLHESFGPRYPPPLTTASFFVAALSALSTVARKKATASGYVCKSRMY